MEVDSDCYDVAAKDNETLQLKKKQLANRKKSLEARLDLNLLPAEDERQIPCEVCWIVISRAIDFAARLLLQRIARRICKPCLLAMLVSARLSAPIDEDYLSMGTTWSGEKGKSARTAEAYSS